MMTYFDRIYYHKNEMEVCLRSRDAIPIFIYSPVLCEIYEKIIHFLITSQGYLAD